MAIVYRCDRCNKEDVDSTFITSIEADHNDGYGSGTICIRKQICFNCFKELVKWIELLPKQGF